MKAKKELNVDDFDLPDIEIDEMGLECLLEEENPLDQVEKTGNAEQDSKAELSVVLTEFRKKAKEENKRFKQAVDSEFWFAVCFRTREQKEAFLKAMQWITVADKYLDGHKLAKMMGIELPGDDYRPPAEKADTLLKDHTIE